MQIYPGRWHGKKFYFGLHYDLHAGAKDTDLGSRCGRDELVPMLKRMGADFVQTDCKGHPGYTSWLSRVPTASVSPGVVKDAMEQWRAATRELGMPLHCHYSGIWDKAAGAKYPDWCALGPDGKPGGAPFGPDAAAATGEKMCPRGPYVDQLLIPQMLELIDRYGVDGFWVDGDLWGVEPCYCERCRAAFTAQTGIAIAPTEVTDPHWIAWWNFTLDSFRAYVTRYCDAVHAHKAGVLVCSNWLQTFRNPGPPTVPTDWISGDNTWVYGLDGSRCEARFLSTRGKPWDIMLWGFYCSLGMGKPESPWVMKPVEMVQQEAAVLASFGGQVQVYENPPGLRTGQLVGWRLDRLAAVGRFLKRRRTLCQEAETIPQIAVLHSEHHFRASVTGRNMMWGTDAAPVQGAVFSLLECHYGVDILDEWALLPRLAEFPVVVAAEQDRMSEAMVGALKTYVKNGGCLVVTGAPSLARFGTEFVGAAAVGEEADACYYVPAAEGAVPLFSKSWLRLECTSAKKIGTLGKTPLLDEQVLPYPAAVLNRVGKGRVLFVPAALFRDFEKNRYPLTRSLVGELVQTLRPPLEVRVIRAPVAVDVVLRRKGARRIVHLVNRTSGIPNQPNNGAIDEIPHVGPIDIILESARAPGKVRVAFEDAPVTWHHDSQRGRLHIRLDHVRIHAALVVT